MASHEAFLRGALSKYHYSDIAKRDILNAFQNFTGLRPKLDTYVFNDGSRKELLCLEGTVPVVYRGNTYNIPLCLWLMDTHPYNPPVVYVKPTATMRIMPGKHVDANGKVYLPYLHEWKHPQSDLLGLIQVLTIVFGEEPPVYSHSGGGAQPQRSGYPSQGGMPYPAQVSYPSTTSTYQPPSSSYSSTSYPSYPGYPPQSGYPSQQSGYPGYPGYNQQQSQTNVSSASNTLPAEQIRASLLSAVEDKMKRRLKEIFAQAQAEMDALKKTQEDLGKGKQKLEDMLAKLEREQNEVERNVTILQEKDEELCSVLEKMENSEEVDIDDAVVPTAPLYRQLLSAFAEEQATEDTIYYLAEGLKRNVIDLDCYLKQVRELSRKQFFLRAIIQRCRLKAGLPEVASI